MSGGFKLLITSTLICSSISSYAGKVRSMTVDASKMFHVNLRLGRSTVLTFEEKPKKVVIGNQNYYGLEFVEGTGHITLQPQGTVATNMFVYGENKVYGFILNTSDYGAYDDLVKVRWKPAVKPIRVKGKLVKILAYQDKKMNNSFNLSKLKVEVHRVRKLKKHTYIVDMKATNDSNKNIDLKKLSIRAKRRKVYFKTIGVYLEKDKLQVKDSSNIRVLLKIKSKRSLSLMFKLEKYKHKMIIHSRYL